MGWYAIKMNKKNQLDFFLLEDLHNIWSITLRKKQAFHFQLTNKMSNCMLYSELDMRLPVNPVTSHGTAHDNIVTSISKGVKKSNWESGNVFLV